MERGGGFGKAKASPSGGNKTPQNADTQLKFYFMNKENVKKKHSIL
jgi:hypothetical protein